MKLSSIVKNFSLIVINREASGWFAAVILLLLLTSWPLQGQKGTLQPSRAAAEAAWNRGDFEVAYNHYNGLLLLYSRDPVYKHYTGACLTEMQRDLPRAVELLGSAINSSVNVKSVPDEVWFYYGRALQMIGNFYDASDAFNRFARAAGKRLAQEYDLQRYLDQCARGEGAIDAVQTAAGTVDKDNSGESSGGEVTQSPESERIDDRWHRAEGTEPSSSQTSRDGVLLRQGSGGRSTEPSSPLAQEGRAEQLAVAGAGKETGVEENSIRDTEGVPEDYERVLAVAVKVQHDADSLAAIADAAARELQKMAPEADETMHRRAAESREKADARQAEADALFLKLEAYLHGQPQQEDEALNPVQQTSGLAASPSSASATASGLPPSSNPSAVHPQASSTAEGPAHALVPASSAVRQPKLLSLFEVRHEQAYGTSNPVPIDITLPEGLVYTIQIAAFKNPLSPSLFKGLYPVYGKLKKDTGITFYYTGFFRRIDDARQALPEAREAGFPDAFVIALMSDSRISMERAAQLEKEWGVKPLPFERETAATEKEEGPAESRPVGTLSFRAEVLRTENPEPEMIEKIELLAGQRGLDIIKNNEGESVFLIGNFITFESAEDYVSLLIRNGYSAARVAAYVGMYEIPVEAARELLKRLPDD